MRERVCWEADQHITLNKLMSQCQFATERRNSPETSVEVRLITSITVEPWLPAAWTHGRGTESQKGLRNLTEESEKSIKRYKSVVSERSSWIHAAPSGVMGIFFWQIQPEITKCARQKCSVLMAELP